MFDVQVVAVRCAQCSVPVKLGVGKIYMVANFPLDGDVRNQTLHGLRIEARRVAGIGIAVGVTVRAVE